MSASIDPEAYRYRGARALVLLHERELRRFVDTWQRAKASGIVLPKSEDPSYVSLEHLLHHVLRAARGYMTWMCECLGLPEPQIDPAPPPDSVESEMPAYLQHLLDRWRQPLASVPEERFHECFRSRWGVDYCVDAMLEHAVTHCMRHAFQLEELMANDQR